MTLSTKKNLKRILLLIIVFSAVFLIYRFSTEPYVLRKLFPEKIWVHRVNSLKKLEEILPFYRGIELDIVWTGKDFDVNHPPAQSIGLSLDNYLRSDKELLKKGLWLDYKNLNGKNYLISARYLDSLFKQYHLNRAQVYVETKSPQYLEPFIAYGFKTSYYLPSGLALVPRDSINAVVRSIEQRIAYNRDIHISAPYSDYYLMKQYFPERDKILWFLGGLEKARSKYGFYKTLLDPRVKVILQPVKTEKGDR